MRGSRAKRLRASDVSKPNPGRKFGGFHKQDTESEGNFFNREVRRSGEYNKQGTESARRQKLSVPMPGLAWFPPKHNRPNHLNKVRSTK